MVVFTATNILNPGESVKFGLVTDEKVNAINWKVLDLNGESVDQRKTTIQEISQTDSSYTIEESGNIDNIKEIGSALYGTKKFIPETIRAGSDIRLVGNGFGSEKNLQVFLDGTMLKLSLIHI